MEFLRAMNVGPGPAPLGVLAIAPGSGGAQASAQGRAEPDPRLSCRGALGFGLTAPWRTPRSPWVARPLRREAMMPWTQAEISSASIGGGRHSALPPGRRTPPIPRPAWHGRHPGPGPAIPGVRVRKVPLPAGQMGADPGAPARVDRCRAAMGALPRALRLPPHRGGKRRPPHRILPGRRRRRGHQAAAASGCVRASRASR